MPNPKLSSLQDPFTATTLNTTVWSSSTAGQYTVDAVNGRVAVNVPTATSTTYQLGAAGPYDATGSTLYARVSAAPNGNGGVTTALKLDAGSGNSLAAQVAANGAFTLKLSTGGTITTTTLPAYSPHAHRWWRFTESAGVFTFATSIDGFTYTTAATVSYSWSATGVGVYFQNTASDTEPSGMVATIAHVNSMLGGAYNLNWPALEEGWGARWNCNGGDSPLDRYVDLTHRTRRQSSVSRGRQYELDQVRAGEASLTVANPDGALDPTNANGPWYGHITPYQPYRKRGQWPPSRNLLNQTCATAGDLGGQPLGTINTGANGPDIFTTTGTSPSFVSTTSAWAGSTVIQSTVPTTTTLKTFAVLTIEPAVEAGATYTTTIQARCITASVTVGIAAQITFKDANQNVIVDVPGSTVTLTGSTTAGWTTLSVSGTAPAGSAYMFIGATVQTLPASNATLQFDGWQFTTGSAVMPWECPGVWYPIYSGFIERWPSQWELSGTYGTVSPTAVDAMALLSQVVFKDTLTEEVSQHPVRFYYTLADPQGSTAAADALGGNPSAPIGSGALGGGTVTFGNSITAANTTTGIYQGSSGSVCTINNASPGGAGNAAASFIDLAQAGITGPATSSWTRMIAFRWTASGNPSSGATIWATFGKPSGTSSARSYMYFAITYQGNFEFVINGTGGGNGYVVPNSSVADGNWHLGFAAYDSSASTLYVCLDGSTYSWTGIAANTLPTQLISDTIGARADPVNGYTSYWNWQGDLAFATEFPTVLTGNDMYYLNQAWRSAYTGESTGTRYQRILSYAGYTGVTALQSGLTSSMGPARLDGMDALSVLQAIVDTENGEHYADKAGTVTFKARSARYNATVPVYVFGERTDLGELPYEECQLDYDPTRLANLITITQTNSGQTFVAQDSTSQTNYFPRTLSRSVDSTSALECRDAAAYLLSRYKNAFTRVDKLVLNPASNPALWPVCLSLELGMRVRVNRRPAGAPQISLDMFIENIQIDTDDTGAALWTLQCSPVDSTPYGVLASFHTTLNAAVAAGVTSIVIRAGADTTNPAAAQIGPGQKLVLGQNTANAETVTVAAVGATSAGWSTATITLQAATTNAHAAGDTVCELLPSGTTDPTTWDQVAKLDSVAFAY